jgi:uncharacterized protein (UPF0262 family)
MSGADAVERNDADHRIVAIALDERTVIWRNADVEQERRVAIFDILEGNSFRPTEIAGSGPWRLKLRVEEGRLALDVSDAGDTAAGCVMVQLSPFRRTVREYFAICDSYYKAIRNATPSAIETIDMARRGIHNEAAAMLMERLEGKAEVDFDTARRLFTLICVLHIRQ